MNVSDIRSAVLSLNSLEELRVVSDALRLRWKELQNRAARSFVVGDKVEWDSRTGVTIRGTVKKINQKTVLVTTESGLPWKVSGSLLREAK